MSAILTTRRRSLVVRTTVSHFALSLAVPKSILKDFAAYRKDYNKTMSDTRVQRWPEDLAACVTRSIELLEETAVSRFARAACGVRSCKVRLKTIRRQLEEEPLERVKFTLSGVTWALVRSTAIILGISDAEAMLVRLDYHAGLWRAEVKARQPDSLIDRFERSLAKEGRKAR
jgi:hypothetical protein